MQQTLFTWLSRPLLEALLATLSGCAAKAPAVAPQPDRERRQRLGAALQELGWHSRDLG